MPNEPTTIPFGVTDAALLALAAALLVTAARRHAFTERGFADAPPRDLNLGAMDLVAFVAAFALGIFASGIVAATLSPLNTTPDTAAAIGLATFIVTFLPAAAYLGFRVFDRPQGLRRAGLQLTRPGDLLRAPGFLLPVALAISIATTLVRAALGHTLDPVAHTALDDMLAAPTPAVIAFTALTAVVAAPVLEEVVFRGLLQTALRNTFTDTVLGGRWPVILSASALFAVVHLGAAPAYALPALFTIGVILGWWYEKTGSLWPCIAAHAAFNALSLLATLAMSGALTEPPTG